MLSPELMEELRSKELFGFNFRFNGEGLDVKFHPASINKYSQVVPAQGCDIVINGASTHTSRIYSVNPEIVEKLSRETFFNNKFEVLLFGYCEESEKEGIVKAFKEKAVRMAFAHCTRQIESVNALYDAIVRVSEKD
jgi:hypothetical protein